MANDDFGPMVPIHSAEFGDVVPSVAPVVASSAAPQGPTMLQSAAHGAGQGFTFGFGDEINGGIQALGAKLQGDPRTVRQLYRLNRDTFRREDAGAKAAHPIAYGGAQIAASIPATFVPGLNVGKGAGLARTMLSTGAAGALAGAGESTADDLGGMAADTLIGGGLGAGAGALGYGLGKLAGKAADKARLARADAGELANKAAQKTFRTARSSFGGEASAIINSYDNATKVAANVGGIFEPQMVAEAQARLNDPKFIALVRRAAQNSLDQGVDRLTGSLATAENVFETAKKGIQPQAIDAKADELLASPIRKQVVPRLKTYFSRIIPIATGTAIGGPGGAVVGGATAAAMGHPGTALANMLKSPGFRNMVFSGLETGENALSRTAVHSAPVGALELSPDIAAMIKVLRGGGQEDFGPMEPAP